jgi:hypothetical protein
MTWKTTIKKLKELNKFELKKVIAPKYTFNKGVFNLALIITLLAFFSVLLHQNFDFTPKYYFVCEEERACVNPFYQAPISNNPYTNFRDYQSKSYIDCPGEQYLCNTEYLLPGAVLGEEKPLMIQRFPIAVMVIFGLAFIANHVAYNMKRGRR